MYASALRRKEVYNLNVSNVNFDDRTVHVMNGKGNKDRFVPMTKKASHALMSYLKNVRPDYNRNSSEKALFLGEWGRRLSDYRIAEIVHEYSPNPRISCHSLRCACATHMLKRGANILYIQQLLGHNSPKTTQIYTRLYPRDLIGVYKRFHPR